MPWSKDPLKRPLNQLVVRLGIAFKAGLLECNTTDSAAQMLHEDRIMNHFNIPEAIQNEEVQRIIFQWNKYGELSNIKIIPHPKRRRVPGFYALRKIFFTCLYDGNTDWHSPYSLDSNEEPVPRGTRPEWAPPKRKRKRGKNAPRPQEGSYDIKTIGKPSG